MIYCNLLSRAKSAIIKYDTLPFPFISWRCLVNHLPQEHTQAHFSHCVMGLNGNSTSLSPFASHQHSSRLITRRSMRRWRKWWQISKAKCKQPGWIPIEIGRKKIHAIEVTDTFKYHMHTYKEKNVCVYCYSALFVFFRLSSSQYTLSSSFPWSEGAAPPLPLFFSRLAISLFLNYHCLSL